MTMPQFICWVCRRKIGRELPVAPVPNWGKCVMCSKTREAVQAS